MRHLGFVLVAYAVAGGVIGGYLLSLVRRQRSLERRLEALGRRAPGRSEEGVSNGVS